MKKFFIILLCLITVAGVSLFAFSGKYKTASSPKQTETTPFEWEWNTIDKNVNARFFANGVDKTNKWATVTYTNKVAGVQGDFYKVYCHTNFAQEIGVAIPAKYAKAYYQHIVSVDEDATLDMDFYYDSGTFKIVQCNGTYNVGAQSLFPAGEFHKISIPLSTLLENWDAIDKEVYSHYKTIIVGVQGADAAFTFYVGNLRINTNPLRYT